MDMSLTPAQERLRADVRAFIRERLPDDIRLAMCQGFAATYEQVRRWQKILNERGWAAPHWPVQYGGCGYGETERLILMEELYLAPAPLPLNFNVGMLGPVLLAFGTEGQKTRFLPKLASLDLWFCQGFSEPGAGSDLASLRTRAEKRGDAYVVNGQKIWTSSAHIADWIFCLVRTSSEGRKQEGISFLMIDMKTPGITVRPIVSIDGEHHLNEVFFDDVEVPEDNMVGKPGQGWTCARHLLRSERLGVAHVGMCRERLEYARRLLKDRGQGWDGAWRELAVLEVETRALEITQWRLLAGHGGGEEQGLAAAAALKIKGAEIQQAATSLIQRIAGRSTLELRPRTGDQAGHWAAALAPRYLYLRAASIYGGSTEIQKEIIARACLERT